MRYECGFDDDEQNILIGDNTTLNLFARAPNQMGNKEACLELVRLANKGARLEEEEKKACATCSSVGVDITCKGCGLKATV